MNAADINKKVHRLAEEAAKALVRDLPNRTTVLVSVSCNQTGAYQIVVSGDKFVALGMSHRASTILNEALGGLESYEDLVVKNAVGIMEVSGTHIE